ncbi:MAG: undecaprenyl/decaprenyl-phosphate alpha-N-acetylglucosaminyl 1-phosphate transferase [Chitinophagales bacterium]|nr:undecaprenyl/decaprenyl-phosphate alpha-N-acetylglucosaminyl 1-phosphate transferase [Chitinophagales bacterium]
MIQLPSHLLYLLCFVSALIISIISIPQIIMVATKKRLYDTPDNDRKIHLRVIPNLGGIGIFFGFITTASLFISPEAFAKWNYIIAASLLLFLVGIADDLISLSPSKKFFTQFIAAFIVVCVADIRLKSLHGILGVYGDLPYWWSAIFSIVGVIFITNAYNLIDGIDGLAGSIGVLSTLTLGISLAGFGHPGAACLSFCLLGGIVGFLRYNISPAKIFMGDTGSLLIGFIISLLCIMAVNTFNAESSFAKIVTSPANMLVIGLSVLFVPVFDTFRVFTTRLMKGVSPFKADRTHLHHYLLDMGFTHTDTVVVLIVANILIITVSLLMQDFNPNFAIFSILAISMSLFAILYYMRKAKLAQIANSANNPPKGKTQEFPVNKFNDAANGK